MLKLALLMALLPQDKKKEEAVRKEKPSVLKPILPPVSGDATA